MKRMTLNAISLRNALNSILLGVVHVCLLGGTQTGTRGAQLELLELCLKEQRYTEAADLETEIRAFQGNRCLRLIGFRHICAAYRNTG